MRYLKQIGAVLALITVLSLGLYFWFFSKQSISTEDAYINANIVQIAPRVGGQIKALYVENNEFVKKGQLLLALDPIPFQLALEAAEAQYAMDQTAFEHALSTAFRTRTLVKDEVLSKQTGDDVNAKLKAAQAAVKLSAAKLKEARLRLPYTKIIAPTSGWISNLSARGGNMVLENQSLFAMIDQNRFWVDANFKETELEHIQKNQRATIKVDMYPHKQFRGIVTSISGGSGTAFSLLPPQNATGNWVKITQRVPVKVEIIGSDPHYPLRLGTSAKVRIDLRSE